MVIPHTKNVNTSCRMHFELTASFRLVLCDVHKCNCCWYNYVDTSCSFLSKLLLSLMRDYFPETSIGCTASYFKIIWCFRWFCNLPLLRLCIILLLYLRSLKGGCCSISESGWFVLFVQIWKGQFFCRIKSCMQYIHAHSVISIFCIEQTACVF